MNEKVNFNLRFRFFSKQFLIILELFNKYIFQDRKHELDFTNLIVSDLNFFKNVRHR